MLGIIGEKKDQFLQLIKKIVFGQSVVLSVMVVNQEQVPAPLHSTESTEPVMIPEPAKLLKDADERFVPRAIWAVQHGCQRLVVMLNDTDTVLRIALHPYDSP